MDIPMFSIVKLPRGSCNYPITIAEARSFMRQAGDLLSENELAELIDYVALRPECGVIIPGTGGVRKLRWRGVGKGKSKGLRIIYFYHDLNMPLFLLAIYSKGDRLSLTKREERMICVMVEELKEEYSKKWGEKISDASA